MTDHLLNHTLQLADNSLIMGHRLSEWTGHGPSLEQDIAISNIALDHIGQARNFYQYAAELKGKGATEDSLAYLRQDREFKNLLITELPNGDWAKTITKLFFFSSFQFLLYKQLNDCGNKQLSAIAAKSFKEVTYHRRWSSEWMIRMGDGTVESHQRVQDAVDELYSYTGEMFKPSEYELRFIDNSLGVEVNTLRMPWDEFITEIMKEATITLPANSWMQEGGKSGVHTEHLGFILAEMQHLQRTYPGCEW